MVEVLWITISALMAALTWSALTHAPECCEAQHSYAPPPPRGARNLLVSVLVLGAGLGAMLAVSLLVSSPGLWLVALAMIAATAALGAWTWCMEELYRWRTRRHEPVHERERTAALAPLYAPATEVSACTGWKLAHLRQHGEHIWLEGAAGGHYDARAEARCNQGGEHLVPEPSCTCGFHAWSTPERAEAYREEMQPWWVHDAEAVLLRVELSGDILVYEGGFRAQTQDVAEITCSACACGKQTTHLDPTPAPVADLLLPRCRACASPLAHSLDALAARLGVEVTATPPA